MTTDNKSLRTFARLNYRDSFSSIIVGFFILLSLSGCQSHGVRSKQVQVSNSVVTDVSTPHPNQRSASVDASKNRSADDITVQPVAYNSPQSELSEQSTESSENDSSASVSAASDVVIEDSTMKPAIPDSGLIPSSKAATDYPIDLTTAMRLAGANHLQVAIAAERICEARARLDQANVLWVPSVNVGVGYNRHDGPIQDTSGNVIDVSRQSLYFGGGPTVGASPLSGGASGPARLFVDLSTADILFEPLAARQNVQVAQRARQVAENNNVLQVGLAYQELVRAHMQIRIADEAIRNAEELLDLTQKFEDAGKGLAADTQRARTELQQRLYQRSKAQESVAIQSAELVRLLRLDSSTRLIPFDSQPLPIEFVSVELPIEELIAQGLSQRPELAEHRVRVAETMTRIEQEKWRPWLPHLFLGYGGAGFGGGSNSDLQNFGVRGDLDALAVWQVRNMGLGNSAIQREKGSQHRQAHLQFEWIRDQVIAEVAQAYSKSLYRKQQMEYAEQQIVAAADALPLNLKGIRDGVIRPIEAQQAIASLAGARSLYLASVIDFNQAQLELVRALGEQSHGPQME